MTKIRVRTEPGYVVHIRPGALAELPGLVGDAKVAVLHTANLAWAVPNVRSALGRDFHCIEVPDAESGKTPEVLARCWDTLAQAGFTRSDVVVGLGGGATTDLAGFVAATWLRGVGYVAVPTSLLAMVDAALGGKTGINLNAGKNLVGAFHEPTAVLCDLDLVQGLAPAEVSSGLAEVIKCGFIADTAILELVAASPDKCQDPASDQFAELVARAIRVKADVVAADLRERTSSLGQVGREALNYGHTLGHAIEALEGYRWRHGPAIAVGMTWMALVSRRLLDLDDAAVRLHSELFTAVGLPTTYSGQWPRLRETMSLDKKTRGATLRLIGVPRLGAVELIENPDEAVLAQCYGAL